MAAYTITLTTDEEAALAAILQERVALGGPSLTPEVYLAQVALNAVRLRLSDLAVRAASERTAKIAGASPDVQAQIDALLRG